MPHVLRRIARFAGLAIVAALAYWALRPAPPVPPVPLPASASLSKRDAPPPPPPAGPAALALVSPLAPGGSLGGFTVREIRGVEKGRMRVVCARDAEVVKLDVALAGDGGPSPPASVGRYAIFYALRGASAADGERLAKKLAEVIGANAGAEAPPGMTTFTPDPDPSKEL